MLVCYVARLKGKGKHVHREMGGDLKEKPRLVTGAENKREYRGRMKTEATLPSLPGPAIR